MTTFKSWMSTDPDTGAELEVVPRYLLAEMTDRYAGASSSDELGDVRERAACVVERAATQLESGDEVAKTLAAQLRETMLSLIQRATRA